MGTSTAPTTPTAASPSPRGAASAASAAASSGSAYTSVLPPPVSARSDVSPPASTRGSASDCAGVGDASPAARSDATRDGGTPSDEKPVPPAPAPAPAAEAAAARETCAGGECAADAATPLLARALASHARETVTGARRKTRSMMTPAITQSSESRDHAALAIDSLRVEQLLVVLRVRVDCAALCRGGAATATKVIARKPATMEQSLCVHSWHIEDTPSTRCPAQGKTALFIPSAALAVRIPAAAETGRFGEPLTTTVTNGRARALAARHAAARGALL